MLELFVEQALDFTKLGMLDAVETPRTSEQDSKASLHVVHMFVLLGHRAHLFLGLGNLSHPSRQTVITGRLVGAWLASTI